MARGTDSETLTTLAVSLQQLDDLRGDLDDALRAGNRSMAACLLTQIQRTAAELDDLDDARPVTDKPMSRSARVVKLDVWMAR